MRTTKGYQETADELRQRATKRLLEIPSVPDVENAATTQDALRLVQELRLHQIELELQAEELQRAREEAERSLARYAELYEFAPVGYLSVDRWGVVRNANFSAFRLLGVERAALIGMRLASLISADDRLLLGTLLGKAIESRTKQSCEALILPREGRPVTVEMVALAAEDGETCRIIVTDISERRRTQEMLAVRLELQQFAVAHERNELLRRALDEIERMTGGLGTACYVLADEQRTLVREAWSTRTIDKFRPALGDSCRCGLEEAAVWADCVSQRRPIVDNKGIRQLQRSGLPELTVDVLRQLVVPIVRKGEIVALVGVANKMADFTEDDVNTVAYLADVAWEIAEQKEAEADRRKLLSEMERSETIRVKAIGTLAGGMAQEFNNLLAGVLGGLTLMDLDSRSDGNHAHIQEMMQSVSRASDLTRQLLGFLSGQQLAAPLRR